MLRHLPLQHQHTRAAHEMCQGFGRFPWERRVSASYHHAGCLPIALQQHQTLPAGQPRRPPASRHIHPFLSKGRFQPGSVRIVAKQGDKTAGPAGAGCQPGGRHGLVGALAAHG